MGGSQVRTTLKIRNTFIIFILSGFWHGANWTFVIWGIINAIYFLPLLLTENNRKHIDIVGFDKNLPSFKELSMILLTFSLTVFAWIFFRAENISQAFIYIKIIFSESLFSSQSYNNIKDGITLIFLITFFIWVEWIGRKEQYAIAKIGLNWKRRSRSIFYSMIIFMIGIFMASNETPFIYFQF